MNLIKAVFRRRAKGQMDVIAQPAEVKPPTTADIIAAAESVAQSGDIDSVLAALRPLGLQTFGDLLWRLPEPDLPALSKVLPKMADEHLQRAWTGNSGLPILNEGLHFMGAIESAYRRIYNQRLRDVTALDFGCGYGRMIRLMYFYTSPGKIWGVDPWLESITTCEGDRVQAHFAQSDYFPTSLPVQDMMFDLQVSYSVFTHLSERACLHAFAALRKCVRDTGMLAITIRPREYWLAPAAAHTPKDDLQALHDKVGFAFHPHPVVSANRDVSYGDTSMEVDWIKTNVPNWKVAHQENYEQTFQRVVFLVPV